MNKFYTNSNRIADTIERQQERIDKLVKTGVDLQGNPITATLEKLDATMAVTASDHASYQTQQAQAAAAGRLNTDEALLIYTSLGDYADESNGGWTKGVGLATKVVITQVLAELLAERQQDQ